MAHDVRAWDETEETGLRLCPEKSMNDVSSPTEVTACCWDTNSPGMVGLCAADGSFVLVKHESEITIATSSYAVYFSTLPIHLWGRRAGESSSEPLSSLPVASAPARRVPHEWSQVSFVPDHPGEILFVQGRSCRVLWARLPRAESRKMAALSSTASRSSLGAEAAARGRFGLVDGSRVVALDGHRAQVQCMSIDGRGQLLLTGDDSGAICARLLYSTQSKNTGYKGAQDAAYRSQGLGVEGDSGGVARVVQGAHEGGVLAISHIEGSSSLTGDGRGDISALFVSGGKGGIVRLLKAVCRERRRETAGAPEFEVHVEFIKDMLVGGFQVSCLTASLSLRVPLVIAGTAEGTVFAFHLQERELSNRRHRGAENVFFGDDSGDSGSRSIGDASSAQVLLSDDAVGTAELGVVLMKFEHTRKHIEGVCCSQEQELIAVADADGIVRTYRPLPQKDATGNPGTTQTSGDEAGDDAKAQRFELIVECRLGACPVSCEFGLWVGREGASGHDRPEGERRAGEVLRTCAKDGSLRVWPTASLPTCPIRPSPPQPLPPSPNPFRDGRGALAPLPHPPNSDTSSGGGGGGGGGHKNASRSHAADVSEQENKDPSDPFARWAAIDAEGREASGGVGAGGEEGGEGEPTARGEPPLPKARPAAPRRVSFAPADQVYKLRDPYYSSTPQGNGGSDYDSKDEEADEDGEFEAPRPPPPAPAPMPVSDATRPRRLRQAWGASISPGGGGSGSGSRRGSFDAMSDSADSGGVYVTPSKLQEASLWSTALEQAALERRMREEFDAGAAPEPTEPAYRTAAAAAVNIHPLARTFEGLVPVSLDAPLPRPKRKPKQVSKNHLSKVQEQRITEEDLAFDDMEPDCSSIAGLGSTAVSMWQREELEWYGGQGIFADLERSSMASDRVWALGRRL